MKSFFQQLDILASYHLLIITCVKDIGTNFAILKCSQRIDRIMRIMGNLCEIICLLRYRKSIAPLRQKGYIPIPYPFVTSGVSGHAFHRLQQLSGLSYYLRQSRNIQGNSLLAVGVSHLCAKALFTNATD